MVEGSHLWGRIGPKAVVCGAIAVAFVTALSLGGASGAPPSAPKLSLLPPPQLSGPRTVEISESNRYLFLEDGRDYVVRMPDTPFSMPGGISIVGGRNVVIVGGEIFDDTPIRDGEPYNLAYGIFLQDQTGTVHLEGLWIHGRGIGQAIVMSQTKGATVQVVNSLLAPLHPVGYVHTDGIQTYAGPWRLRLNNVTIRTAGVGIQTQPHELGAVPVDRWAYRRVNVVQTTRDAYALWKAAGHGGWWRQIHEDLWVRNLGNYAWPTPRHWNPGGPAMVEGSPIRKGVPPKGSYVQARWVGLSYVPPRRG
jgi:hypothetical protein